jgi:hypothetical protein
MILKFIRRIMKRNPNEAVENAILEKEKTKQKVDLAQYLLAKEIEKFMKGNK